jgi:hypothetical protein
MLEVANSALRGPGEDWYCQYTYSWDHLPSKDRFQFCAYWRTGVESAHVLRPSDVMSVSIYGNWDPTMYHPAPIYAGWPGCAASPPLRWPVSLRRPETSDLKYASIQRYTTEQKSRRWFRELHNSISTYHQNPLNQPFMSEPGSEPYFVYCGILEVNYHRNPLLIQTLDFPSVGIRAGTDQRGALYGAVFGEIEIYFEVRDGLIATGRSLLLPGR